jgi:hypothetical protein
MNSVTVRLTGVPFQRTVTHGRVRRGTALAAIDGRAAEEDFHAREELAHREGLAEVVVGADLQPEDAVELFVAGGEKDDRRRLRHAANAPAELEAVHLGHRDVEDHEPGEFLLKRTPGFESGRVELDRIALAAHGESDRLADVVFVVDDRDETVGWTHAAIVPATAAGTRLPRRDTQPAPRDPARGARARAWS